MSLIYSMHMSVDGYVEDKHGRFDFTDSDEEVNPYINQLTASVGAYLHGRSICESIVYWETVHSVPNLPQRKHLAIASRWSLAVSNQSRRDLKPTRRLVLTSDIVAVNKWLEKAGLLSDDG